MQAGKTCPQGQILDYVHAPGMPLTAETAGMTDWHIVLVDISRYTYVRTLQWQSLIIYADWW